LTTVTDGHAPEILKRSAEPACNKKGLVDPAVGSYYLGTIPRLPPKLVLTDKDDCVPLLSIHGGPSRSSAIRTPFLQSYTFLKLSLFS
jgi:hypothetical protein